MKQETLHNLLIEKTDIKNRDFSIKLKVNETYEILGIKMKDLKEIAKELCKNEGLIHLEDFFNYRKPLFYEDVLISYFTLSFMIKKIDIKTTHLYLDNLLKYNNSWATNDAIALAIIPSKKDLDIHYKYLLSKLSSTNYWDIRFAIVSLMKSYLNDEYIDSTLKALYEIQNNEYYVQMALGWAFATALAKQKDKTYPYIFNKIINPKVNKIAIQKAIESKRISEEDKIKLRILRDEVNKLL